MKIAFFGLAALVATVVVFIAIEDAAENRSYDSEVKINGDGWKIVRHLRGHIKTVIAEVSADKIRIRKTYEDAGRAICAKEEWCRVAFFAEGDRIPEARTLDGFLASGGFGAPALASWVASNATNGEIGIWNCERAGIENSPLNQLCDPALRSAHRAVLALGLYSKNQGPCGWPNRNDMANLRRFIASVPNPEWRAILSGSIDEVTKLREGPDDIGKCSEIFENNAKIIAEARKLISRR